MAIIGTLRKHSGWLVAFVGIAILAFILGDLTKNRGGMPDLGKVNGDVLTSQHFNDLVAEQEDNYRLQQQTSQVPNEVENQIREQVWQQFVQERLMEEQTSKMGLCVTSAEMNDMYTGKFIHPYVRQSFSDPQTGQFDIRQINYWIENFDQLDTMRRLQWTELERAVRNDREQQKFSSLITSAFYMPKAIAKMVAQYGNSSADVRIVSLPFSSVSDDEAVPAEADYKTYYDKHVAEFKVRDEFRQIEFITYPVLPTREDEANILADVNKTWDEFQNTSDDEMAFFVNAESDTRYDSSYRRSTAFRAPMDELVASAKAGDIFAPVRSGNEWMMAKVLNTAMRPDSLRASVVYIFNERAGGNITRSSEQARLLADSVLNLLKTNRIAFEEAVSQFSDDPQKDDTKGDMGWQLDGGYGMLNEQIVNTPVGGVFSFEHPQGVGYFVVKVTEKTVPAKKFRVALITREVLPSNATNQARYNEAGMFASQNRSLAELEASAQKQNLQWYTDNVSLMSNTLRGVRNARSIVQWAYNEDTKIGDVADQVFECDGMFVVVALKDVFKKGTIKYDQARNLPETGIEQGTRIDKKADVLMARASEAIRAAKELPSIAMKLSATVDTVDSVSFNDYYLGRYGMEPKVQSAIAVAKKGIVGPVKGASGVYVVEVVGKQQQEVVEEAIRARLEQGYRSKARMINQVLMDNAKIVDQRNKFF